MGIALLFKGTLTKKKYRIMRFINRKQGGNSEIL